MNTDITLQEVVKKTRGRPKKTESSESSGHAAERTKPTPSKKSVGRKSAVKVEGADD